MQLLLHWRRFVKQVTLRNLPPELAHLIRKIAEEKRISVNKAVIGLLEERVGGRGKRKGRTRHHDLDALAGSWTKREAESFDRTLSRQRAIDPDLWK
jgi:hypothetical protein